jgi:hypothetical protein
MIYYAKTDAVITECTICETTLASALNYYYLPTTLYYEI